MIAILAVLAGATYLVLQRPGERSREGGKETKLFDYDSAAVDKFEMYSHRGHVIIEKQAGQWVMTFPMSYKADQDAVTAAIGKGKNIALLGLVSSNPEKQGLFEVDSTHATIISLFEKGVLKANFFIGKPGPSYNETYVRRAESNDVYLARDLLAGPFLRLPKDWRDKTIFKTEQDNIKNVRFAYGDTTFTLSLQDSVWRIGKDSVSQATMKHFLTNISHFQSDELIDSAIAGQPKPTATLDVNGTQIRFYLQKDASKYYIQTSLSPQWFEAQQWRVSPILKRKKELITG
jgi:hypothetical protein